MPVCCNQSESVCGVDYNPCAAHLFAVRDLTWLYACIKARLLSTYVVFQLNFCPAVIMSLCVEDILNF